MILLNFVLNNPAVQVVVSSTRPGATIKIIGVDAGNTFNKNDYFISQSSSAGYMLDNDSSFSFVINYLVDIAGGAGNGIGKLTGTGTVDTAGVVSINVNDIYNKPVTYTIASDSYNRTVNLDNLIVRNSIEYTTSSIRYRFTPTPNNATVELYDSRDGSTLPPVGLFANLYQFTLPVPNANGTTIDVNYSISADKFTTATGKLSITRTASTNNSNSVAFATNGDEESYTWNGTSNPRTANITLVKIATDFDISFNIVSGDFDSIKTLTIDGVKQEPDNNSHYIIPFPATDKTLLYTIEAENFHTIHGELLLKPNGEIEDKTSQTEKDGTIKYQFDTARSLFSIQMMPAIIIVPTGPRTASAPVGDLLIDSFKDPFYLFGSKLLGGKMELINQNPSYEYEIIGIEITGTPKLAHNAFRTFNKAVENLSSVTKFSTLRDILDLANIKYPSENFTSYYDYLLFYYKTIYVSEFGTDCSKITTLDELPPLDLSTIWAGPVWTDSTTYDGTQADVDAGLVFEVLGPQYAYIENDEKVAALAEKLIAEYTLNMTFDNTKAGPIPISVAELSEQNKGLQFYDYVHRTTENLAQVAKMFDFTIPSNSTHRFTQIGISSNGSYAHNGFQNNGLVFDFNINLILKIPGHPYDVDYYVDSVSAANLIATVNSTNEYDEGHQITTDDLTTDLGANWLNDKKPANCNSGIVQGSYPIISANLENNRIVIIYSTIPPKPVIYTYYVEYYKDTVTIDNLINKVNSNAKFAEDYQLTINDVNSDLGINWLHIYQPIGYQTGVVQGKYPVISTNLEKNKITVLYSPIPEPAKFPYTVEYYRGNVAKNNLIANVAGITPFIEGYQLTKIDIDNDLGMNWINIYEPFDCDPGKVYQAYPIITIDTEKNKVIVLYQSTPLPTLYPYKVEYYRGKVNNNNLITQLTGLTSFKEGYQLIKADIDKDFGVDWLNMYEPFGFNKGSIQGAYPTISIDTRKNRVIVLYQTAPLAASQTYRIEYYKDNLNTSNLIERVIGLTSFEVGYRIKKADIDKDFGSDWVNMYKPYNYKAGNVQGIYPVITIDSINNIIRVLYTIDTVTRNCNCQCNPCYQICNNYCYKPRYCC